MLDIIIKQLDQSVEKELFRFELENRNYFERIGLSRDKSYYDFNNFQQEIKELIEEQEKDLTYMYLIKNSSGEIVGRVNLFSVMRGCFNKAEIGYRIGEKHQRRGYATVAVRKVLEEVANKHKLHRIEAGTSPDNIGSQIVLIKNGFQFVGRYSKYIYNSGKWNMC